MGELATLTELRGPDDDSRDAAQAALRWLRVHAGRCLLVFDNAVDADLIRAWTPPVGSVQAVVTSTVRALDALGDLIDVDQFTPSEAVDYLHRRTGLDDAVGAADMAAALGWLPLALDGISLGVVAGE